MPWQTTAASQAETLTTVRGGAPGVQVAVYPLPDYQGRPWSQWGQGVVLPDGRFLSAVGDHIGQDGNSYFFEYNPETESLSRVADVLALVPHQRGAWGYGKVHAQMLPGPCGSVWVTTYWGTRRDITYGDGYEGDIFIEIDPAARTIGSRGLVLERHGVPSLAGGGDTALMYGEAVDPYDDSGVFVVYDPIAAEVVWSHSDDRHIGFRSIAVDDLGRAYYSLGEGRLARYDPAENERSVLEDTIPGDFLRAATAPDDAGIIYGVTRSPARFFALDPDGGIRDLGPALSYTTSLALTADQEAFLSVPAAHGKAWTFGAPLVAVDTDDGDQEILVELAPLVEDALGLRLGGTYSIAADPARNRVFIGMNASAGSDDSGFGHVVLVIVTLP